MRFPGFTRVYEERARTKMPPASGRTVQPLPAINEGEALDC